MNSYKISVKEWVAKTHAVGLWATAGRCGGTYAHKDIAFEFGMWISPEFKVYLIKEFQRLKDDENRHLSLAWNLNRTLSKLNYRIHTDAIKAHLIPSAVTPAQAAFLTPTRRICSMLPCSGRPPGNGAMQTPTWTATCGNTAPSSNFWCSPISRE